MAGSWPPKLTEPIGMARSVYKVIYFLYGYLCHIFHLLLFTGGDEATRFKWSISGLHCVIAVTIFLNYFDDSVIPKLFFFKDGMNFMFGLFNGVLVFMLMSLVSCFQLLPLGFVFIFGPYGLMRRGPLRLPRLPIGRSRKFWTDIVALCIVLLLRYSFEAICHCLAWIAFVAEYQIICKLAHAPRDLVYSDVLVSTIMRLLVIYPKENDSDAIKAKFVLCVLIIYYMHWSTPPATPIFNEVKQGCETKELQVAITIETHS